MFCSAAPGLPPRYLRLAGDVGAAIAGRGWSLVSGGERVSMMGAIAAAARDSGAHTLGVVPRALIHRADQEADELVVTETMGERKARMVAGAHALLALPGGLGTCEELFEAWTGRLLGAHTKPIVVLDADGHFTGLLSWLERARDRGFVSRSSMDAVVRASSIAEALDACTAATVPSTAGADMNTAPDLRRRLAAMPPAERCRTLLDLVLSEAAAVLEEFDAGPGPIEPDCEFFAMGLDSLAAVRLRNRLAALTGLRLLTDLVFEYPTPAVLADRLSSEMPVQDAPPTAIGRAITNP